MTKDPLRGFGVLVTRPTAQAADLSDAIRSHGGAVFHFPAIEIVARTGPSTDAIATALPHPDIVIFVSTNAVEFGIKHAGNAQIGAIGPATAAAIRRAGRAVAIESETGFDSESLLQHPGLNGVAGKQVRIIRGGNGRELLTEQLQLRGATVNHLTVYDRKRPVVSEQSMTEVESKWRNGEIHAITVMSVETLANLAALLPEWCAARLEHIALVTPATRVIKAILDRYPAATPTLASGPQTADMLRAIQQTKPSNTDNAHERRTE